MFLTHFISVVQAVTPQTWWWWRQRWRRRHHNSGWRRREHPGAGRSCMWTNCQQWRGGRCECETPPPSSCWSPATGLSSGRSVPSEWRRRTGRSLWPEPWTLRFSCWRPGPRSPEPCCTWSGSLSLWAGPEKKQRSGPSWRTLKEETAKYVVTGTCKWKMQCVKCRIYR